MTANCDAPNCSVSHYVVPRKKYTPSNAAFHRNSLTTKLLLLLPDLHPPLKVMGGYVFTGVGM